MPRTTVTFALTIDRPPFDELTIWVSSRVAFDKFSKCTSDPLHEQISDSSSSGLAGAGCDEWVRDPEKTVTLIKTGTEETERIEPCEMREDELEKDEVERERGKDEGVDDTLMSGDDSDRHEVDDI